MGLFAKAAANKAKTKSTKKPKKQTTWKVGSSGQSEKVAEAVSELVKLKAEQRRIDAQVKVHKAVVQPFAEDQFFRAYADTGVFPETPMVVMTTAGEKVTFVVQDRSAQYGVKDDQVDDLVELLGEDGAEAILYEETKIAFNRDILALEGVSEAVEAALEGAIGELMEAGTLTEEQAGELIDPIIKRTFKPGTLDRLAVICGKDITKMEEFVDCMGSSCTRYIKA